MQKLFRAGIGNVGRLAPGRRLYAEALNPYFGYFYTVKKSLAKRRTKYQTLQLIDTDEFGKVLLIDNITQVADRCDREYHEPMVHPALCAHRRPETVLVIGGGDGGILRETLKYPSVKHVDLAELDGGVIEFSKKYLPKINAGAFRDGRVRCHVTDGRRFTEEHPKAFDVVVMDMTDPSGPSTMLYTREFFRSVKRSFRDEGGVFVMHSESPITRPRAFAAIQRTLRASFRHVMPLYCYIQMYATLWSVTLCSQEVDFSGITSAAVDKKLKRIGIDGLSIFSGATFVAMQAAFPYVTKLLEKPARIITDARPEFPDDFLSYHPY
jgi:spermidine synthase